MRDFIEVLLLQDGQVVVPEFSCRVKHEPDLLSIASEMHSLVNVVNELRLVLSKLGCLLSGKFSVFLVTVKRYQVLMPDLNFLFQQEFDIALSQNIVCL